LYGTTPEFLKHFGLNEITDLPKPREIEELLGETELEVEKRMLANQEELEFKEKLHEKLDPNSRAPHIPRKKSKLQEPQLENEGKTVIEKATPLPPPHHSQEKIEDEAVAEKPAPIGVTAEASEESRDQNSGKVPVSTEHKLSDEPIESGQDGRIEAPPQISSGHVRSDEERIVRPAPEKIEERNDSVIHGVPEPEPAAHSGSSVVSRTAREQPETNESKKGWSTWKTKIQTFFRKLFG